jgi:tRNA pseudouridine55 synthase
LRAPSEFKRDFGAVAARIAWSAARFFPSVRSILHRVLAPGIHLVHKPVGPSSFAAMKAVAEASPSPPGARPPKVCHGGTLDPFASGLLLILVEPATKLFDHLHAIPKVYEATIHWGVETDNGDHLGRAVFTGDPSTVSAQQLDDALGNFVGWHDQVPPATSAKRIDGERAYLKVQRGESVIMPPSHVYLHEARWLDHDLPRESRLRLTVRGGYYVRALARDLGRQIGCGAHLAGLHRAAIGPWEDPGADRVVEVHGGELLSWAASRTLSDQEVGALRQGGTIPAGELIAPDWLVPPGFPDPQAPVRGFHLGRLAFLLRREGENLGVLSPLSRGL